MAKSKTLANDGGGYRRKNIETLVEHIMLLI